MVAYLRLSDIEKKDFKDFHIRTCRIEKLNSKQKLRKYQKEYFILGSICLLAIIVFSMMVHWFFIIFIIPSLPFVLYFICLHLNERFGLTDKAKETKRIKSDGIVI